MHTHEGHLPDFVFENDVELDQLAVALDALCHRLELNAASGAVLAIGASSSRDTRGTDHSKYSRWERALRRLELVPRLTVGALRGPCSDVALDLLAVVDFRIATKDFHLQMTAQDHLFWPSMSLYRLTHLLGPGPMRQLLLRRTPIFADECLALGLIDEIADDPLPAAFTLIGNYSSEFGREFAIRRRLVLDAPTARYEDALGAHLAACDRELRRRCGP